MIRKYHYRRRNRRKIYHYTLNQGYENTIARDRAAAGDRARELFEKYPYEDFERFFKSIIRSKGVYENHYGWQECMEANFLAYMYGIYRCAAEDYTYVIPYIKKVSRIFTNCAVVLSAEDMKRPSWDEVTERVDCRKKIRESEYDEYNI